MASDDRLRLRSERDGRAADRLFSQLDFARDLAGHSGRDDWRELVAHARRAATERIDRGESLESIVEEMETLLSPMAEPANSYRLHYVAHAHIDMNWLWTWSDTVKSCCATFSAMVDLMDEFPDYRFSQSQMITYEITRRYAPELFERIKEKIKAGQWEVTASKWVESDKNMTSGESQLRQLLYARRYAREILELDEESVKIDWATDTFGHAVTTPSILNQAGIRYYYLRRPGSDRQPDTVEGKPGTLPWIFWWVGDDGSRLLVWNNDRFPFVDKHVNGRDAAWLMRHEEATGLRDFMIVYGVGNHGGGPSRADITRIREMGEWPIFPATRFSTVQEFYDLVERRAENLPELRGELNFMKRGCYSSQSRIKRANRRMEARLGACESIAAIAGISTGFEYPDQALEQSWKMVLFNQFHDILPGVSIRETYEQAQGKYQEVEATTSSIIDRVVGRMAENIDTTGAAGIPIIVFNPTSHTRTDRVGLVLYDVTGDRMIVVAERDGTTSPAQTIETQKSLWMKNAKGDPFYDKTDFYNTFYDDIPDPPMTRFDMEYRHPFAKVEFTAPDVPPFGYKTFWLKEAAHSDSVPPESEKADAVAAEHTQFGARLENEFLRVEVEARSSSVVSLHDKRSSRELVPPGRKFAHLNYEIEEPHRHSAWVKGKLKETEAITSGGTVTIVERGPARGVVRCRNTVRGSSFELDIIIHRNLPQLTCELKIDWREVGDAKLGVPNLKAYFPVNLDNPQHRYELPFGSMARDGDGKEVPAQRWGAVLEESTGTGITICNSHTYSYSGSSEGLALNLLRSPYEPHPLPEIGRKKISIVVTPSVAWSPEEATRAGVRFNSPLIPLRTKLREGSWPSEKSFLSVAPGNVTLTAFKPAESGGGKVVRLLESSGKGCSAVIKSDWRIGEAHEIDPLESGPKKKLNLMADGRLEVKMEAHEVKTILVSLEA